MMMMMMMMMMMTTMDYRKRGGSDPGSSATSVRREGYSWLPPPRPQYKMSEPYRTNEVRYGRNIME
jgi:hypothetical protein